MDYTKVPRELIYKERGDLKDFGVQKAETMNYLLFIVLKQQALMSASGAREMALRCFNNAYYVCTLILLEANDFPELRISDYVDAILEIEKSKKNIDEVCLASMAMACLLLAKYDSNKYGKDSDVWNAINYRCTHYQWYNSSATTIFHAMMLLDYSVSLPLSHTEFEPRYIVDAVGDVNVNALTLGYKYVCEKLESIQNKQVAILASHIIIGRLNNELCEIYKDSGYNPETKKFEYEDDFIHNPETKERILLKIEFLNEVMDYFIVHFPTKDKFNYDKKSIKTQQLLKADVSSAEISELKTEVNNLQSQLTNVSNINGQYENRIKELEAEINNLNKELKEANTIPDNVTAQQRVRMELARKLMDAAGINKDVLAIWGNKDKAGTVMGTMLDIVPSTCKTYLSDPSINHEHHKETVDKINPLLEALGLKFKL